MDAKVIDVNGKEAGTVTLAENIFGHKPERRFLHEFVTIYLANQRAWTSNTKSRTTVSGGGRKPWKQKGTGRARSGSIRSGLWRHGAIIHGPRMGRGARLDYPRQKARLALAQALSARAQDGGLICVKELAIKEPKTKLLAAALAKIGCEGKTLIVLDAPNAALALASRNIPTVAVRLAADINAYEVLYCKKLVITQPALEKLGARWN
ncbi:MAG: 50S ribosomal protein L4 [Elusimicrobia bacterium RIFCSPHIGHO2_02_FULL_61_10]|nr:MAG: 50S ribosomal protein L4 [Elusimicrobia bacterium RIFCSPHIGHO2_02_FULL_61_10]